MNIEWVNKIYFAHRLLRANMLSFLFKFTFFMLMAEDLASFGNNACQLQWIL